MTEAEWLECTEPQMMLEFLKGKASDRKLRLFTVACCRSIWPSLTHQRSRLAVEVAEQYADGNSTEPELHKAHSCALNAAATHSYGKIRRKLVLSDGRQTIEAGRLYFAGQVAHVHKPFLIGRLRWVCLDEQLKTVSPSFLREIICNPFRPLSFNLSWQTSTVQQLAEAIYQEKAFDRLPILADALEDSGCDNAELLNHFRQPGEHVRGCWALDLVLGKE